MKPSLLSPWRSFVNFESTRKRYFHSSELLFSPVRENLFLDQYQWWWHRSWPSVRWQWSSYPGHSRSCTETNWFEARLCRSVYRRWHGHCSLYRSFLKTFSSLLIRCCSPCCLVTSFNSSVNLSACVIARNKPAKHPRSLLLVARLLNMFDFLHRQTLKQRQRKDPAGGK